MIIAVNFRTGIAEVTGSNPVEALIFSVKFTAMIILHFHLQPLFIYELFHINFTSCPDYGSPLETSSVL